MPVVIIVGVQWGDEGKGKVVDYLTEQASLVVRFQGGDNAGHTVVVSGEKTALRLIPSGILRPNTRCLLASGVVLNPDSLLSEIESLQKVGIDVSPQRLGISSEVQLILPYHRKLDAAREEGVRKDKIGTTQKGIGPTYEDAVTRMGIRVVDLFNEARLERLVQRNVELKNRYLKDVLGVDGDFDASEILSYLKDVGEKLKPYATNVSLEVEKATAANEFVMFEGAQGTLLDISHGTYPFVTSSNTVAGYACVSAGFSPRKVDDILGICKAYCTRVGSGPFPSEDEGRDGDRLRERGKEFGTVTKRPRRCGWFDVVAAKKAIRINGIESLFLTKLDVLSGFETVKIAKSYFQDGALLDDVPTCADALESVEVEYEELPGWSEEIGEVRSFEALPVAAQNLVKRIEELLAVEISGFSVGPDRAQTILLSERLRAFTGLNN